MSLRPPSLLFFVMCFASCGSDMIRLHSYEVREEQKVASALSALKQSDIGIAYGVWGIGYRVYGVYYRVYGVQCCFI